MMQLIVLDTNCLVQIKLGVISAELADAWW